MDSQLFNGFLIWATELGQICSAGNWIGNRLSGQRNRSCSFITATEVCPLSTSNALAHSVRQKALIVDAKYLVAPTQTGTLTFT